MRLTLASGLLLLSLSVTTTGYAKCPFIRYTAEGRLLLPPGLSPDRARVYLFVDGMKRANDYPATALKPDFALPRNDGYFQVESWVSTASGDPDSSQEQCKRTETAGEIFVTGEGIYSQRVRITFTPGRKEILKKLEASAQVDSIQIERLPQE